MNNNDILKSGVILETNNSLLEWGKTADELASLGSPQSQEFGPEPRKMIRLLWRDVCILRGLRADLWAEFEQKQKSQCWSFNVLPHSPADCESLDELFCFTSKHLHELLGEPKSRKSRPSSLAEGLEYPVLSWCPTAARVGLSICENSSAAYIPYLLMTLAARREHERA